MTRPTKHPKTGVYRIRMAVPEPLRSVVGRWELARSLGTKDASEAKRLAPAIVAEFEAVIARAAGKQRSETVHSPGQPADLAPAPAPKPPVGPVADNDLKQPTLRPAAKALPAQVLLDAWAAETNPAPATRRKYANAFAQIASAIGFDDISRITAEHVVAFKESRLRVGKDAGTVADDILAAGAVCRWAVKNRKLASNAFEGLAPRVNRRGPAPRVPYDDAEAARILTAARAESGWLRWLPWLLCFTGARISEIVELRRGNVRQDGGVWVLDLRPNAARAGKNSVFQRLLPLHPALGAEGFLAYVGGLPDAPDGPLFPDLKPKADGTRAEPATTIHQRWIRKKIGIKDAAKAPAHSWRHRMEDELRKVRASPEVQDAITGRNNPRNTGAGYGKGFRGMPAEVLKDLAQIPSPLAPIVPGSLRSAPVPEPGSQGEIDRLVSEWFEGAIRTARKTLDGFAEKLAPEGAGPDERRSLDQRMTAEDAERQIERLQAEYRSGDHGAARPIARAILLTMANPPGDAWDGFDQLTGKIMGLLGKVQETRLEWSAGNIEFRPTMP